MRRYLTTFLALLTALVAQSAAQTTSTPEKLILTAREIRYDVQCPMPRTVPCSIKKPVLSGYRVMTEKITLDDQGAYWIAHLGERGAGSNEPIRILTDNGVWHLITVRYASTPRLNAGPVKTIAKQASGTEKPLTGDSKGPSSDKAKNAASPNAKETTPKPDAKPLANVEACYERCRSTP